MSGLRQFLLIINTVMGTKKIIISIVFLLTVFSLSYFAINKIIQAENGLAKSHDNMNVVKWVINNKPIKQQVSVGFRAAIQNEKPDIAPYILRRAEFQLDGTQLKANLTRRQPIKLADSAKVKTLLGALDIETDNPHRQYIEYDPYVLETKNVGDKVDILIPQLGKVVSAVVQQIDVVGDIVVWKGSFDGLNGQSNSLYISQTMLGGQTIGVFETNQGYFNMEIHDGIGWIIDQQHEEQLVNVGEDNFIGDADS